MKRNFGSTFLLLVAACACAQSPTKSPVYPEAEYYIWAYAQHYRVPVPLVRAVVEMESNWRACVMSSKGAVGLMQLMPATAERLGVRDRCNINQNVSGGVRYLAWLMRQFHGDLRLVAAAYYAGENIVGRRGLAYRNRDVVTYVARIRATYLRQTGIEETSRRTTAMGDMR
jgi:soluble lytic murein transglycosylase-like protein